MQEIADVLGVSRWRAHQLIARDGFPAPLAPRKGGKVWADAAVRRWEKTWVRKQGQPLKNAAG